jgi:hypothetical protein
MQVIALSSPFRRHESRAARAAGQPLPCSRLVRDGGLDDDRGTSGRRQVDDGARRSGWAKTVVAACWQEIPVVVSDRQALWIETEQARSLRETAFK